MLKHDQLNKYEIVSEHIYQYDKVLSYDCNDIAFVCLGTCPCIVSGIPLVPAGTAGLNSFSSGGNENEVCSQEFEVSFQNTGALVQDLLVIRKVYKDVQGLQHNNRI